MWPERFLDALLELDLAEQPHGLYGIRQAHVLDSKRLPTLAQVLLSEQRTNFVERFGMRDYGSRVKQNELHVLVDQVEEVEMQVLDMASTKVRQFGSVHRLDTHHGKPEAAPAWNLEKLVPKLSLKTYHYGGNARLIVEAILLAAHAPTAKALRGLLGRAAEPEFLARYPIELAVREWQDRYGRGFQSGLYLWIARPAQAKLEPA